MKSACRVATPQLQLPCTHLSKMTSQSLHPALSHPKGSASVGTFSSQQAGARAPMARTVTGLARASLLGSAVHGRAAVPPGGK